MSRPKLVAITGGIASGKSTIGKALAELGDWVVDADDLVRKAYTEKKFLDSLAARLPDVIDDKRNIKVAILREHILSDKNILTWLEGQLHPYVRKYLEEFIQVGNKGELYQEITYTPKQKSTNPQNLIAIIPLLFETGFDSMFDIVVTVTLPKETQYQRALAREGVNQQWLSLMMDRQMKQSERNNLADYVIAGDLSKIELRNSLVKLRDDWVKN